MQTMPSLLDRRRLKDRVIESISKAVKQIQEYQFNSGQADVVLTNNDWQFCKLVEHLDHAFLHGLRHITNGYWAVVQDFTHQATIKEVKRMANVTTNLGRGRAWLYLALMDHLLESYLRCFLSNISFVKKFYAKEALVLDQQRMEILLTLAAGLEFITFQLDVDAPYLDLSSHMRPRLPSQEDSIDRISLCSMDSSMSQSSSIAELTGSLIDGCEMFPQEADELIHCKKALPRLCTSSTREDEENSDPQTQQVQGQTMSSSRSMPQMSTRIDRMNSLPSSTSFDLKDQSSELEVIHVRSKLHKSRRSKRMKKRSENDLDPDTVSLSSLASVSSDCSVAKKTANGDGAVPDDRLHASDERGNSDDSGMVSLNELEPGSLEEKHLETTIPPQPGDKTGGEGDRMLDNAKIEELIQESLYIKDQSDSIYNLGDNRMNEYENMDTNGIVSGIANKSSVIQEEDIEATSVDSVDLTLVEVDEPDGGKQLDGDKVHIIEHFTRDLEFVSTEPVPEMLLTPSAEELSKEHTALPEKETKAGGGSSSNSSVESSEDINDSEVIKQPTTSSSSALALDDHHPSEVKVHINLLLLLKLHVMEDDEEQLLKLFQTTMGHTEGDPRPIYVLVSSNAIYLLTATNDDEKVRVEANIPYQEVDYILLGVNDQVITLVCTNRRKKFWLSTGDETLTRSIVSEADKAIRLSEHELPRLSVLTEPTQEKIVMKKWAAQECKLELSEVQVLSYVLVHWEEQISAASRDQSLGARKEGTLLVRMHTSLLGTPKWKPNYFVLKDGMLYQYTDKMDGSVPIACVQLSGEDCAGCRRSMESDRQHCFELILADRSVLQMCAANAEEAQEWLLCLCQAVAESSQKQNTGEGCLACCGVVTQNKLLMCHEDVQTNFFRTLGSANVTDITSVFTDPHVDTYLVIAFESQEECVSNSYWTLYFNARGEMQRLLDSLSHAWMQHFKVTLPVSELKDVAMAKRCREGQGRLRLASL